MASNQSFDKGIKLALQASNPASPASGGPLRLAGMTGVALTDMRTADSLTPTDFGLSAWALSVKGVNDWGNVAVAIGDRLYYVDADTPKISKKASGVFFGYALAAVNAGATATINVINAVPASPVSQGIGYLPLPIGQWRLLSANDIAAIAVSGGTLAKDTTPILERVNAATDKQQRIRWAAAGVGEIAYGGVIAPPDLDITQPVAIKIYAAMGGATDTPTVALSLFEGVGGSNLGGNTAAVTGTTPAVYSYTIAAVTGGAGAPKPWSFGLTPGAHGTDTFLLYSAWVEYVKK